MAPAVVPPLIAWGDDIKQKAADLLMYELKSWLGLAPQEAAVGDENVIIRAQLAREYFDAIGDGKIDPPGLVDSSADGAAGGAISPVESDDPRCW
jgi:hypothetical protein